MEISKVETFACLVPKKGQVNSSFASSSQSIIASPADEEGFYLYLNDDNQELSWNVSQSTTPEINEATITEITRSIDLALKGYDTSFLMISKEDSTNLYQQRKTDIETILDKLNEQLKSSNQPIQIEYCYLGLTDDYIYDLRKDAHCSNNTFFEKGLDFFMRTVDSVEYIQNKVKRGSKLPFVLTIRLTNLTNNTQGNLQIVDLLRPPFTLPSTKGNRHLYRSFSHLLDIVHKLVEPDLKQTSLNTDLYVLSALLSNSLAGRTKFAIYAYLNDQVEDHDLKDTIAALNLLVELGQIPTSRMIPNASINKSIEYRKIESKVLELTRKNAEMEQVTFDVESMLKVKNSQVKYLEAAHQELFHRPSKTEFDLKKELSCQRVQNCMLDLENKKLQFDLKSQQDIDQSLREQLALQEALIQQLQNDQAGQIEQLQSEQATTIQQLQSEQADKIRQLQIDQTNQQSFGDQQLQDKLNQYQGQIDQLKQELQASIAQKQEVEDDLYSQFKQKISSVKRKNELKMEALKEKCDQAIRIVQEKERKHYKEMIDSYNDMHKVKLQNEVEAMTKHMTDVVSEWKRELRIAMGETSNVLVNRKEKEDEEGPSLIQTNVGRRKLSDIASDHEEKENTRLTKNKPGRRKLSDVATTKSDRNEESDTELIESKVRGRKSTEVIATAPKKKRGRPSKKDKALLLSQPMQVPKKKKVLQEAKNEELGETRSEQEKELALEKQYHEDQFHQELEETQIEEDSRLAEEEINRPEDIELDDIELEDVDIESIDIEDIKLEDTKLEENHPEEIEIEECQPEEEKNTEKEEISPPPYDDDNDFMEEPKIIISLKPKTKRKTGRSRKSSSATSPPRSRRKRRDLSSINEDMDDVVDIITVEETTPAAVNKEDDDNDVNLSPVLGSTTPYRQSSLLPPPPSSSKKQQKKRRKLQPTQQSSQLTDDYFVDSDALSPFSKFLKSNNVIAESKRKTAF